VSDDKRVSDLLDDFQWKGLYGFDRSKVEAALSVSSAAVGKALKRPTGDRPVIAPAFITEWSQQCPWISLDQVEHAGFLSDTPPLLRPGIQYNPTEAFDWIQANLISRPPNPNFGHAG